MGYKQDEANAFAERIKALGFRVFIAASGEYGFITDEAGASVVSFSMNDGGNLGGNYGPPSQKSGTGWQMEVAFWELKTAADVRKVLDAHPPRWCGDGWKHKTTLEQHLAVYQVSSKYREI